MMKFYPNRISFRSIHSSAFRLNQDGPQNPQLAKIMQKIEKDKKKLKWRTPYSELPDTFQSKFKLFSSSNRNSELIEAMQQPVDLSPTGIKKWWNKRRTETAAFMQQYIPERHNALGEDLACAHFVVHREGSVRFRGQKQWIKMDEKDDYDLPRNFVPNMVLEEVKCDNMDLFYEGLENIRQLRFLKHLSFENVSRFDDWYLDRISGNGFPVLEELNLRGTAVTYRGLHCLYRLPSLKVVLVDEPEKNIMWQMMVSQLEEWNPNIAIKSA
ncbi:uncharacterized protein LOC134224358 [Armigeres subalbatus]|uniref:uncharacterized protein LOC134224358 n=1 Tax=Armigeres subalbatus TaxID=124917 RepID=UPI002ED33BA2